MQLGEFEYLMLTAVARLGEGAYGVTIRQEIEDATGRPCSLGALYTTIERLESKGLVKTSMGDPTPQRGGRPKRMVRITPKGAQAASEFYNAVMRVSRGVAWSAIEVRVPAMTRIGWWMVEQSVAPARRRRTRGRTW